MGADTKAHTRELVHRRAAYFSERSVELPLRPFARAAPPLGPRLLLETLQGRKRRWELSSVNGR